MEFMVEERNFRRAEGSRSYTKTEVGPCEVPFEFELRYARLLIDGNSD